MPASSSPPASRRDLRLAVSSWARAFLPGRMAVNARERSRVALGAALGVLIVALICHPPGAASQALPWLIAPMGASALLVFGVPASPMAQPWAVVGGNTLSVLVGIACVHLLGTSIWAAAAATGLAIALMFAFRCLHPPGGASALMAVLAGVHDPRFALFPVLVNALLLVAGGLLYNPLTGRRYPHGQQVAPAAQGPRPAEGEGPRFSDDDLDAVLARYNQVLDVSRDDLRELLQEAELESYRRHIGTQLCRDIMSREPISVHFGTPLQEAWMLLRRHHIKALPVVDRARRLIGIITLADFLRGADIDLHEGWTARLRKLLTPSPSSHTDKPEVVGQIMNREVRVASAERPLADMVPIFADTGHHHIPIIDEERRLVGIVTQTDLVAALARSG